MRLCACVGWIWICAFCACSKTLLSPLNPFREWSGVAEVFCILRHRDVQLILAYSWVRLVILVAGKDRVDCFYFYCFFPFIPVPLSSLSLFFFSCIISSISFLSFDFSTLYTTIPDDKLKSKLKAIINQCFFHKYGNRRFQYVVIGYKDTYFIRDHSDAAQKYSDADVIKMLEYLIDNISVEFGGRIFQQTIGKPYRY